MPPRISWTKPRRQGHRGADGRRLGVCVAGREARERRSAGRCRSLGADGQDGGAARDALCVGGHSRGGLPVLVRRADKSFTAAFGSRTMQGTYEFAGESHDIVLHFATNSNYDLGTFSGKAYLSGTDLQLLFPATRLLKLVDALGRKLAAFNATAATVSALVGKFDDLWLGFEFKKE